MTPKEFEALVADAFELVPEKFKALVKNVALLIEATPDEATRRENNLAPEQSLFELYKGTPRTERGDGYGVGMTLPDSITIYRDPILHAAADESGVGDLVAWGEMMTEPMKKRVKAIVRDTIWHEIAHYFGMDEFEVAVREGEGTNEFSEVVNTTIEKPS
jgi:predicted Zn-dependent protease with MMP-like domain